MARELPIQNGRLTTDLDANGFKIKNLPPGSGFTQAQADWSQSDSIAVDFIKNKPATMPPTAHTHPQSDVTGLATALAGKISKAEAEAGFTEWVVDPPTYDGDRLHVEFYEDDETGDKSWSLAGEDGGSYAMVSYADNKDAVSLVFVFDTPSGVTVQITATRTRLPTMADIPTKTSDLQNDSGFLAQHQQLTPVYSQTPTFSEWTLSPEPPVSGTRSIEWSNGEWILLDDGAPVAPNIIPGAGQSAVYLEFQGDIFGLSTNIVASRTRTDIIGYTLGNQTTKPLQPKGDYAPATNIAKTALASGVQASLGKADTAVQPAALRYDLPANATAISSASSETVEGETVTYGEATLADRTANRVSVTAAIAELRLTFPAAVSGKVRDFGLRVEVGTGSAALTAPSLVPPAGVTLENSDGAIPALADGTATAAGVTLLYFSETSPNVFLVKGEQVKEA